jgi:putative hydrolase of the HAD superfamily
VIRAPGPYTYRLGSRDPNDSIALRAPGDSAQLARGIRTGLISNSWGAGRYDRDVFPELFDGVVISGDVGMHKPQPEIFRLGAERIGVPPEECVFVDDLKENCAGAEEVGMTAVLHRGSDSSIAELERLLGVELR